MRRSFRLPERREDLLRGSRPHEATSVIEAEHVILALGGALVGLALLVGSMPFLPWLIGIHTMVLAGSLYLNRQIP